MTSPLIRLPLLLALATCGGPPSANDPIGVNGVIGPAAQELIGDYRDLCLVRFPDMAAVRKAAESRRLKPMAKQDVDKTPHADRATGWWMDGVGESYTLTVEAPPYPTCVLRKVYKQVPSLAPFYQSIIGHWASDHNLGGLRQLPPIIETVEGHQVITRSMAVLGPDGTPSQTFIGIVTPLADGTTELRLMHEIPERK